MSLRLELCGECQPGVRFHPGQSKEDCQCSCHHTHDPWCDDPECSWVSIPKPYSGPPEEVEANMRTHHFGPPEGRCWDCDVRMGSISSAYRCGTGPGRVMVRRGSVTAEAAVMTTVMAAAIGARAFEEEE